jgi:hypothetical protein
MREPEYPRLKFLHQPTFLVQSKLDALRRCATEVLRISLLPGHRDSLKARRDGTLLDGHHRITVLLERGEDVHKLPREIMDKEHDS